MIAVTIPVGPNPIYREYLNECIDSLGAQTVLPKELVVIDDQARLNQPDIRLRLDPRIDLRVYKTLWLSGVSHAFNYGVALASKSHELTLMLGSDDWLQPWAIEDCVNTFRQHRDNLGYYYLDVEYSDGSGSQSTPCNAAMVHRDMWLASGGFPIEASLGQPDTILISIMMGNPDAGHLINVTSGNPPYIWRMHEHQVTRSYSAEARRAIHDVRNALTRDWAKPAWTEGWT